MSGFNRHDRFQVSPGLGFVRRFMVLTVAGLSLFLFPGGACSEPEVVTRLAQLDRAAEMDRAAVVRLRLEGTVWWSGRSEGRIILGDASAVLMLELDVLCAMPASGDRLMLEGDCLVLRTRDAIKLSGVPVVDNNGLHPPEEKSGRIRLTAGRHPVRVDWFDRTDRYALEVAFEGPQLPRQKIPDELLFHAESGVAGGATNVFQGLEFRCFEGAWWRLLPNFDHMPSVKTGTVNNFDIGIRSRTSHVGVQFRGFIEVPEAGEYTFYLKSDDGSRLFVGPPSLKIRKAGRGRLPGPQVQPPEDDPEAEPAFQWLEVAGEVAGFYRRHGALEVDLMTASGPARLNVAEDSPASCILQLGNRIRAAGVSRRIYRADGRRVRGEFFVQRWADVEQQYVSPRIWSEYPLMEIGSLANAATGVPVHVRGRISTGGPAQAAVLEDESGRIAFEAGGKGTPVSGLCNVLGRVESTSGRRELRSILVQPVGGSAAEAGGLPLLESADEICKLSFDEAAKGYPVRIRGVVIGALDYNGAVVHDSSRGIYISSQNPPMLQVGDYCEVEGVTGPFGFDPFIQVSHVRKLGKGMLPAPVEPTWDQLINGAMHCNYVELEGVVASVDGETVELLTRDGRINVRLNPVGPDLPEHPLGATIRLRGCLLVDWDGASRQVVVGSMTLDQQRVTVVHPAPADPFDAPLKRIGDILQFDPQAGALQRIRVAGLLIGQTPRMSFLMDGKRGLRFVPVKAGTVKAGDRLEVVGFADLSGPSPLLRDAEVRRLGSPGLPEPRKLGADELVRDEFDATRVQVEGVLVGVSRHSEEIRLEMQNGLRRFMAVLNHSSGLKEPLTPGSRLLLTGVYVGQGGNRVLGRAIDSFELLLGSERDVAVLSRPPWWTLKRLMMVVALLVGMIAAALVWINLLHRKVDERTQQLGDQIRQRQRVERQRAIEQERARLAHDLHDDLGAGLTEVNMLSSLVKNPAIAPDKKTRYADKMNDLALHMVTSLDEIVWAENPRNDTVASLAAYFESYTYRLFEPVPVGCHVDVAENLPDQSLDPQFRRELFLAFKEALTNVIKHAEASELRLNISVRGKELVVVVSDNGCGVASEVREAGADGLANMQERLSALGGSCEIESDPATGTTVCLRAPIQRLEA